MASSASSAERKPPKLVYRGDGRGPKEIFSQGFSSRGEDDDVIAHVEGGSNLQKSGYISTSQSLRIPGIFMQPVLKNGKLDEYKGKDGRVYTYRKGWVYHINTTGLSMLYVPDKLPDSKLKPIIYNYQQEWSVKSPIPGKNIKLAQRVEGYIYREDLLDGRGPFPISPPEKPDPFTTDIQENPHYAFK